MKYIAQKVHPPEKENEQNQMKYIVFFESSNICYNTTTPIKGASTRKRK